MSGRRPGASTTRQDLLDAARAEFAEHGVRGATTRRIATRAGVDPAMITHHFGSKAALWQAVLELPVDPAKLLAPVRSAPPEETARALLGVLLRAWDSPLGAPLRVAVRHAIADPAYADRVREFLIARAILPTIRRVAPEAQGPDVDADRLAERAALTASQLGGLILARYLIRIEPLASADPAWIVDRVAPTVQRYLTGPLP